MRYIVAFLWIVLFTSSAFSQPVVHTVHWEKGVYKKTVLKWIGSLDKVGKVSSTSYIRKKSGGKDKLHRKGHRDVIVWIPETSNLTQDFIAIIWFHGHYGYVPKRTFENRTLKQLMPLTQTKNFVLILPEMPWSVHTTTPSKRNSLLWLNPGDFIKFVVSVNQVLQSHVGRTNNDPKAAERIGKIDYRIVGHSAGGSTIKRLGITGDLCRLGPSMVVWSDSSYGPWLRKAWDGCLTNYPDILVKVFVAKGDAPWLRATQFMGEFQDPPKNLELHVMRKPRWSHKLVGDNVVKLSNLLE